MWFVGNKARKTCPDCRIVVTELPAPAYVVRRVTQCVSPVPNFLLDTRDDRPLHCSR